MVIPQDVSTPEASISPGEVFSIETNIILLTTAVAVTIVFLVVTAVLVHKRGDI